MHWEKSRDVVESLNGQIMKTGRIVVAAGLALMAFAAPAQTAQEAAIRKMVESRLGEGVKVDSITKTPYSGLYEVRIGTDIIYTDAKASYLFVGRIIDAKTMQDQTKAR